MNDGVVSKDKSVWERVGIRVWNAIKHIFGQSDWQIASKKLAGVILADGDKNSENFSGIVFPGLREDTFSYSEAREIANNFLNVMTEKSQKTFPNAILSARKRLDRCAGEILFRKAIKNSEMFSELDLKDDKFVHASRKEQLEIVFHAARNESRGFKQLTPLLYDIAQEDVAKIT